MAAKPRKKKYDYRPYPKHDGLRSGCKVGWYYYRKREDAEKASEAARHNAAIQWELGYDFGYCSPGSIMLVEPGRGPQEYLGMWEVCRP